MRLCRNPLVFAPQLILLLALLAGLASTAGWVHTALADMDYSAWTDLGIVYTAPASGNAYYPSMIYDANGFGGGTPLYKMWYSNGSSASQAFVITATNGANWGSPQTLTGLGSFTHHVQVLFDPNCFSSACGPSDPRYRIWYLNTESGIYTIAAISTAQSVDGVNWAGATVLTQSGTSPLITGAGSGWNRGTYGPVSLFYQAGAANSGTNPWDYSYVMYYDGTDGSAEVTGLAYSADGLFWTAYSSTPVLNKSSGNAWDCDDSTYGTVFHNADGYHFWYSGGGGDNGSGGCAAGAPVSQGIGYASSSNGFTWIKDVGNPIFHISDGVSYRNQRVYTPAVVDDGSGVLKMYYSAVGAGGVKKIGLAVTPAPPSTVWVDDNYSAGGANDGHLWGYDAFAAIQGGVNAVAPDGTVHVASGAYTEQVTINKSLDLLGAGAVSTIIQEPVTLVADASGSYNLVSVSGSGVSAEISGFNLHGRGAATLNIGILVRSSANANIHDNLLDNLGTSYANIGILVGRRSYATSGTATISNNTVSGYGKGGIVVDNTGSSVALTGNIVTGSGATLAIAQNGIQISRGATGTVSGNTVNNHFCTSPSGGCLENPATSPTADGASGILLYASGAGVTISDNILNGNQFAVWSVAAADASISGNTITGAAVPGAFTTGIAIWDSDRWTTALGYTQVGTAASVLQNALSAHDYGLLVRDYTSGGVAPLVHASNNSLVSNAQFGAWSNVALDASANWWGVNSPGGVAGEASAGVDYTPWLDSAADTSANPGFQGDFSSLWAGAASPQTGSQGRIQEAIGLVTSGGTITAATGTYNETLYIDRPLTLRSDSGAAATTLDGNDGEPYGVFIAARDVTLDGFTITNPGYNGGSDASGIVVEPPLGANSNIRIAHNSVHDVASLTRPSVAFGTIGVNIGPVDGVEIDSNEIYNIQHSASNAWANGISVWGVSDSQKASHINIHNNKIFAIFSPFAGDAGVSTQDFVEGVVAHHNSFANTGEYGLEARGSNPVDADENWWNSSTGPVNPGNPAGTGEGVTDHVTYTPWLCSGTDTSPDIGFQPDPGTCTLPARLAFSIQPGGALVNQLLAPQPEVSALDADGDLVTGFSGTVTLTIGTNPASGVLSGTSALEAVNGVATFSDLSIDQAGIGYTLAASSPGLAMATSAAFDILNPEPHITSLSPGSIMAGSQAFLLTVYGEDFLPGSVVRWNGASRPTTFISSAELVAIVRVQDVANPGTAGITVFNPAPGGGASNASTFTIGTNPVPNITEMSPSRKDPGGPDFTVTITGTNFIQGSVVRWNGANRPTSFVDSTQLIVVIRATDIAVAGTFPITVYNPAPGGGLSNALPFNVAYPTADLAISKTSGVSTVIPGHVITYTIVVTNNGPDAVSDATVTDTLPVELINATWACTASSGSYCTAAGTGDIQDAVEILSGGSLTYHLSASVALTASGALSNTAWVSAPGNITDPLGNNSATETTSIVWLYLYLPVILK